MAVDCKGLVASPGDITTCGYLSPTGCNPGPNPDNFYHSSPISTVMQGGQACTDITGPFAPPSNHYSVQTCFTDPNTYHHYLWHNRNCSGETIFDGTFTNDTCRKYAMDGRYQKPNWNPDDALPQYFCSNHPSDPPGSSSSSSNTTVIIILAAVLGALLLGLLAYYLMKRHKSQHSGISKKNEHLYPSHSHS